MTLEFGAKALRVGPIVQNKSCSEGTLSIEMDGHGTHTFSAGQGFAEVINHWHNGRNLTDKPVRFLIVFSGQKGTPNLIRP